MAANTTALLMLVLPLPLLLVGLIAGMGLRKNARLMRTLTAAAAWLASGCALLAALAYLLGQTQSKTYLSVNLPANLGQLALTVYVNLLTLFMMLLVSFVGAIVARYSATYMNGDANEGRFQQWLSLTLGSFFTLISTGNIWGFVIASLATSLCLNKLLGFYRDRPGAVLAARKKWISSKIADVSMLAAFVLIARTLNTSQFADFSQSLSLVMKDGALPQTLQIASGLIVVSAILKSAQFPFHGWLIQVMEAPTPVSALLHAGIIYTGTFLILRTSPIVSQVGWVGNTLVLVGLVSIAAASLIMITGTNIKGSLAYSTCAQMGFVLMQCGLGLYSLAVLHIVAHSVYKAHAFLASGSVVDNFRVSDLPPVTNRVRSWQLILGFVVSALMVIGVGSGLGVSWQEQPALIVMGIILTVAITQLLLQAFNTDTGTPGLLLRIAGLSTLVGAAYFTLEIIFTKLFDTSLPVIEVPSSTVQNGFFGLIVLVFLGLIFIQQLLLRNLHNPFWQALYVHLYNGLYLDLFVTRLVRSFGRIGNDSRVGAVTKDKALEVVKK